MIHYLLLISAVIFACILAGKFSDRIGVPSLLLFMVLGMLLGTDGIFKISFNNFPMAETICSITLIFIMFYGGFGTNWKAAKPVAAPSFVLASLGVVATAALMGVFCHYVLGFSLVEGLLIGSVISSTDAASVFSILRSKSLHLKNGLASVLELESGSNDPSAYMLTVIFLGLATGESTMPIYLMIPTQVIFGLAVGFLTAALASVTLKKVNFNDGIDSILMVAVAMLGYALAAEIGGNGYLSVYVAGILLGNSKIPNKINLVHFFDGITGLMQFALFFLLGLLATPSQIPSVLGVAVLIFLFLTFVARPLPTFLLLAPTRFRLKDKLLVSWAGLRGAASIVFAIMVTVGDAAISVDIFHIVFAISVFSVSIQGTLLPFFSKKLDLVDDSDSVFKTFNDYIDESDMQLIQMRVGEEHPWAGMKLADIYFPPDSLVIMIERGEDTVIPKGSTVLQEEDKVIVSSKKYDETVNYSMKEEEIGEGHAWAGLALKEIDFAKKILVVMIRRKGDTVVPNGDTVIRQGDVLVLRNDRESEAV